MFLKSDVMFYQGLYDICWASYFIHSDDRAKDVAENNLIVLVRSSKVPTPLIHSPEIQTAFFKKLLRTEFRGITSANVTFYYLADSGPLLYIPTKINWNTITPPISSSKVLNFILERSTALRMIYELLEEQLLSVSSYSFLKATKADREYISQRFDCPDAMRDF